MQFKSRRDATSCCRRFVLKSARWKSKNQRSLRPALESRMTSMIGGASPSRRRASHCTQGPALFAVAEHAPTMGCHLKRCQMAWLFTIGVATHHPDSRIAILDQQHRVGNFSWVGKPRQRHPRPNEHNSSKPLIWYKIGDPLRLRPSSADRTRTNAPFPSFPHVTSTLILWEKF